MKCLFCGSEMQIEPTEGKVARCVNGECEMMMEEFELSLFTESFTTLDAMRVIKDEYVKLFMQIYSDRADLRLKVASLEAEIKRLAQQFQHIEIHAREQAAFAMQSISDGAPVISTMIPNGTNVDQSQKREPKVTERED